MMTAMKRTSFRRGGGGRKLSQPDKGFQDKHFDPVSLSQADER